MIGHKRADVCCEDLGTCQRNVPGCFVFSESVSFAAQSWENEGEILVLTMQLRCGFNTIVSAVASLANLANFLRVTGDKELSKLLC